MSDLQAVAHGYDEVPELVCKWDANTILIGSTTISYMVYPECTNFNKGYSHDSREVKRYKYCPYCGRRVKFI